LRFSPGTLVSSTNKTARHYITEILLKVALNTINQPTTIDLLFLWVQQLTAIYLIVFYTTAAG